MDNFSTFEKAFVLFCSYCMSVINLLAYSFTGMQLWNWLLVPALTQINLPISMITFGLSLCLCFVIRFFTYHRKPIVEKIQVDKHSLYSELFFLGWIFPLMTLIPAYIIKLIVF